MTNKVTERPFMPQIIPQTINGIQQAFSSLIKVLIEMFSQYGFAINAIIDVQGEFAEASLSASQTSNLSNGDHIEFDVLTTNGTLVTLSVGAGQADGKLTLAAGHTYKIAAIFSVVWDIPAVADRIIADIRNNTDSVVLARAAVHSRDWDTATNNSDFPVAIAFLETEVSDKEIELRFSSKVGTFSSINLFTKIFVEVIR